MIKYDNNLKQPNVSKPYHSGGTTLRDSARKSPNGVQTTSKKSHLERKAKSNNGSFTTVDLQKTKTMVVVDTSKNLLQNEKNETGKPKLDSGLEDSLQKSMSDSKNDSCESSLREATIMKQKATT